MKLYESLFILTHTYDSITFMQEIMIDHKLTHLDPANCSDKEMFHYIALFKNCIIETCCFFEEYEGYFVTRPEEIFKQRILFVKKAAKPAVDKIKEWQDIKLIRNELLAHGWRSKRDLSFSYSKIFTYNSPRNFMELIILSSYLRIIIGVIEGEFQKELFEVPHYMNSIKPVAIPPTIRSGVFDEMEKVIFTVNSIVKKNNKRFSIDASKIIGS